MAENPNDDPRPADENGGIEDRSEYTPSTAHETGLSFQASPTGLGATDAPATTEGGTAARYETAQSSTNSRAAWTPGAAETAGRVRAPLGPRGIPSILILVLLLALAVLAIISLF